MKILEENYFRILAKSRENIIIKVIITKNVLIEFTCKSINWLLWKHKQRYKIQETKNRKIL